MGQGQTKASKHHSSNGETAPSPKKEAKKPKRPSKESRSSASTSSERGGKVVIEERQSSPTRRRGRDPSPKKETTISESEYNVKRMSRDSGRETVIDDAVDSSRLIGSPPKPKRTFEVGFIQQEKENVPEDIMNVSEIRVVESSPKTPVKMSGRDTIEPFTPVYINDLNHNPQATSTPAPNGIISTGDHRLSAGPYSDDEQDHTDQSDDEAFSSEQQDSTYERKFDVNYGKFYNSSYLKYQTNSQNKPRSSSDSQKPLSQFTRPANFSYAKEPPEFLKSKKGGMMQLAQGKTVVKTTTTRRSTSPSRRNMEAVKMSMFPSGKRPPPKEVAKIDRDDWPAPPSPAALLPEILRQRRKSRGENDDDEEEIVEDPKIKREIEELSKFKDESGIGKIMYKELEESKTLPSKLLDPWKASRVPNAAYEPQFQTRYQSPMFASPSRFLDRPRRAWDDSDLIGYRTMSTMVHFPVPKPGYTLQPRAATLPVTGLYGGPLDYNFYHDLDMSDTRDTRTSMSSVNTETSKVTSTVFDQPGVSLMTFQKSSWHTEVQPTEYQYDRLMISHFDLPKDVDRNRLEIHLSKDEFESIFDMTRDEFRHLPEWKQNDMKRRMDLY